MTLKTGLFAVFFTEKRYRSIITGSINSNKNNIIPIWFVRYPNNGAYFYLDIEICNSVVVHYSAVTVEPPTDCYLNFCTKRDTKLVNDIQQSIVVDLETLPAAPCTACRISLPLYSRDPSD